MAKQREKQYLKYKDYVEVFNANPLIKQRENPFAWNIRRNYKRELIILVSLMKRTF